MTTLSQWKKKWTIESFCSQDIHLSDVVIRTVLGRLYRGLSCATVWIENFGFWFHVSHCISFRRQGSIPSDLPFVFHQDISSIPPRQCIASLFSRLSCYTWFWRLGWQYFVGDHHSALYPRCLWPLRCVASWSWSFSSTLLVCSVLCSVLPGRSREWRTVRISWCGRGVYRLARGISLQLCWLCAAPILDSSGECCWCRDGHWTKGVLFRTSVSFAGSKFLYLPHTFIISS